jgi:hypothetical protein
MTARSLRIVRRNHCDNYLTASRISCRVDGSGELRVWTDGGNPMGVYAADDWISVENATLVKALPTPPSKGGAET